MKKEISSKESIKMGEIIINNAIKVCNIIYKKMSFAFMFCLVLYVDTLTMKQIKRHVNSVLKSSDISVICKDENM